MARKAPFLIAAPLLAGLAAVAYGQHSVAVAATAQASLRAETFVVRNAIDEYRIDKGKNPESLSQLVGAGYLPPSHTGSREAEFKKLTGK
jgi:competence protein ComGC